MIRQLRIYPVALAVSVLLGFNVISVSAAERSGKEVVDSICAGCHVSGKDGAPKIGDKAAWSARAAKGMDTLTDNAISGVKKMPAHGGQASLSDLEMTRAVAYMVSGGNASDPQKPMNSKKPPNGRQLVEARCQSCHGAGKDGAPKIGDMNAWKPRLSEGVARLYKSATQGHNAMPARGGLENLSDSDIRAAVDYMVAQLGYAK